MKTSVDRFLTTHVGSMPRSQRVTDLVFGREAGTSTASGAEFQRTMVDAVADIVRRQAAAGVDIVSDGEMSKISYATYIKDRLTGFDGDSERRAPSDLEAFPNALRKLASSGGTPTFRRPRCVGPIAVRDRQPLLDDLSALAAAVREAPVTEAFMNAASPGVISLFQPNEYYPSNEKYLEALAEAMRDEYEAIVNAGFILQIDAPDLALGRHTVYKDRTIAEFRKLAAAHVEVLNHALRNCPSDRVRMHICWGNYSGPHHHDVPVEDILPVVFRAKPAALLFEGSNPRHEHEWIAFRDAKIPEDKILIPGVLDSVSNFIEHPELVAQRIERFAEIVGAERVIAGTDCGFASFAGFGVVDPDIVFAKLAAMREGADIAWRRLKGRP